METWKTIKGYDGLYEVSNMGRIRGLKSGKILKSTEDVGGYLRVMLSKKGSSKAVRIHRAVAITFLENKHNRPQVNHKNGVRKDNSVENLEWAFSHENSKHRYRNLVDNRRKFTMNDLDKMYAQYKTMSLKSVAANYNIDAPTLHKLLSYMHPDY